MTKKTAPENAAETTAAEQEHSRIVGCLLAGVNPDKVEEQK